MPLPRKRYFHKTLNDPKPQVVQLAAQVGNYPTAETEDLVDDVTEEESNIISSELDYPYAEGISADDRLHAPALDIDLPVECYESSTPGHYHVLIDRPMTWKRYKKLLKALCKAGIIEEGYYRASLRRGGTFLRKKGEKKPAHQVKQNVIELEDWQKTWQ